MTDKRRRYPRVPSKHSVLVKKMGDEEVEGFTKTEVVGLGGCMFASDEALGVGSYLEVLIAIAPTVVKSLCKVVYEIPGDEGNFEVGVEFIQISDSDLKLLREVFQRASDLAPADKPGQEDPVSKGAAT